MSDSVTHAPRIYGGRVQTSRKTDDSTTRSLNLSFSRHQDLVSTPLKMAAVRAAETFVVVTNENIRPQPNSLKNMFTD